MWIPCLITLKVQIFWVVFKNKTKNLTQVVYFLESYLYYSLPNIYIYIFGECSFIGNLTLVVLSSHGMCYCSHLLVCISYMSGPVLYTNVIFLGMLASAWCWRTWRKWLMLYTLTLGRWVFCWWLFYSILETLVTILIYIFKPFYLNTHFENLGTYIFS